MKKTVLLLISVVLSVSSMVAQDAPAKEKPMAGTVKSVSDTALVITTKEGEKSVAMNPKTKFKKAGKPATVEDLRTAKQVAVHMGADGEAKVIVIRDKEAAPAAQ